MTGSSKDIPHLSKNEWLVMNACWDAGKPVTARQIHEMTAESKKWEYNTVKTMLERLVAKGYIARDKFGPICLYKPTVSRARTVSRSVEYFLDTVLGKTFSPLFAHMAKGRKLTDEELESLQKIIDEHQGEDNDGQH